MLTSNENIAPLLEDKSDQLTVASEQEKNSSGEHYTVESWEQATDENKSPVIYSEMPDEQISNIGNWGQILTSLGAISVLVPLACVKKALDAMKF